METMESIRKAGIAVLFVVAVNIVGALPSFVFRADTDWFERPWFFPPDIAFPIAWTALFTLMGLGLFLVWLTDESPGNKKAAYISFVAQFTLNLVWTPVFFGLQSPLLGVLVIGLLIPAIIANIYFFDRVNRMAAVLLLPYLVWVVFAGSLNLGILLYG